MACDCLIDPLVHKEILGIKAWELGLQDAWAFPVPFNNSVDILFLPFFRLFPYKTRVHFKVQTLER